MREGAGAGDQPGREERDAEEQVEAERGADHLGDVAGHRDQLGLQPEADRGAAREPLAAELGEVLAGRDPQLRRLGLHDHRDQVRAEHHPEQQVAELGAAGDVGGEVAGVDVGDGGDEGRAEEGPDAAASRGSARPASAARRRRPRPRREGRPRPWPRREACRRPRRNLEPPAGPGGRSMRVSAGGIRLLPSLRQCEVGARDRRAVRVVARLAELGRDQQLQLLGDVVLEHLGLLVHAVVGHAQGLGEVGLDQAVVADHLERDLLAGRGQGHSLVGEVVDQAESGRASSASRSRWPALRPGAPPPRRSAPGPALLGERVDRLRVVLYRFGGFRHVERV